MPHICAPPICIDPDEFFLLKRTWQLSIEPSKLYTGQKWFQIEHCNQPSDIPLRMVGAGSLSRLNARFYCVQARQAGRASGWNCSTRLLRAPHESIPYEPATASY